MVKRFVLVGIIFFGWEVNVYFLLVIGILKCVCLKCLSGILKFLWYILLFFILIDNKLIIGLFMNWVINKLFGFK